MIRKALLLKEQSKRRHPCSSIVHAETMLAYVLRTSKLSGAAQIALYYQVGTVCLDL